MRHDAGNAAPATARTAPLPAWLLGALLLAAAAPSPAGVYKWVDEDGRVHYGDRPPPTAAEPAELDVDAAPDAASPAPDAAERRERQRRLLEKYERERAAKKAEAAREKERREKLARYCARARHDLRQLEDANYIYEVDATGNRVIFSAEQRAAATAELERAIAKHCR